MKREFQKGSFQASELILWKKEERGIGERGGGGGRIINREVRNGLRRTKWNVCLTCWKTGFFAFLRTTAVRGGGAVVLPGLFKQLRWRLTSLFATQVVAGRQSRRGLAGRKERRLLVDRK